MENFAADRNRMLWSGSTPPDFDQTVMISRHAGESGRETSNVQACRGSETHRDRRRLELRTRNLEAAQICLQSAGYKPVLRDGMILIDNEHAIERPDDIAHILVNAGTPPTHLAVAQQNLEEHFLQLTGGAK